MPHPVFRAGSTALITGGASGIGLAVARLCSSHGMKLALIDNNAESLSKAKTSLKQTAKEDVETYNMDVGNMMEWMDVKAAVEKKFGVVDFLMLNAGIGVKGTYEDTEYFHRVSSWPRRVGNTWGCSWRSFVGRSDMPTYRLSSVLHSH